MEITKKTYPSKKGEITVFRLVNNSGAWVELSTLGAGIISVGVPDKEGNIENVALGYADPADYLYDGPCMGKCPGRYANRIARGILKLDGKEYRLACNCGPNHLHGGPEGFQNQVWEARELGDGVEFGYFSGDGEENYPGNMQVTARYRWNDSNELLIELEAKTDAETVVNLTNHTYWNLRGADSGSVLDHELRMIPARWLPTDDTLVPTGDMENPEDTPMDFSRWKRLGEEINADFPALRYGNGYDNCWIFSDRHTGTFLENAVMLHDPVSGRVLSIGTDQPGAQVYTGNWLEGSPVNRSGRGYKDYDGVAIEAQGLPDAPNHPNFPTQTLRPGEVYRRRILFAFSTRKK